jgi:hypothetical protein
VVTFATGGVNNESLFAGVHGSRLSDTIESREPPW